MTVLDLERYVPFLLGSLATRMLRGASREYLAHFGIGVTDWRVLGILGVKGESTPIEVSRLTGVDRSAITRATQALERDGIIDSRDVENDGRARLMRLTAKGRALHDRVIVVALDRQERLLKTLSRSERKQLLVLLRRLEAQLPLVDGSNL